MRTAGEPQPICQVTGTYAIPPDPGRSSAAGLRGGSGLRVVRRGPGCSTDQHHGARGAAADPLGVRADQEVAGLRAMRGHHHEIRRDLPPRPGGSPGRSSHRSRSAAPGPRPARARARTARAPAWSRAPAAPDSRTGPPASAPAPRPRARPSARAAAALHARAASSATGSALRQESSCARSSVKRIVLKHRGRSPEAPVPGCG